MEMSSGWWLDDLLRHAFVVLLMLSSCFSLVAIRISLITSVTIAGLPHDHVALYCVAKYGKFEGGYFKFDLIHYSVWVDHSITSCLCALGIGVYLCHGLISAALCFLVAGCCVVWYYKAGAAVAGLIDHTMQLKRMDQMEKRKAQ
jgi:hypothetical protein